MNSTLPDLADAGSIPPAFTLYYTFDQAGITTVKLTLSLFLLVFATAPLAAQSVFDRNLIVNGDAESGPGAVDHLSTVVVPDWFHMSAFTAVEYGAFGEFPTLFSAGPVDRGVNFFTGGPVEFAVGTGMSVTTATQTADVTGGADSIDVGLVGFELEGYLGGWVAQDDNAVLTIEFLDDASMTLGSGAIGPVNGFERRNETGLLLRSTSGLVPIGTRTIRITLEMTRVARVGQLDSEYNDGYADNLSLVLSLPPEATETKFTADDVASLDGFGSSVALNGDTALVGAPMDDGTGSAYVFVRDSQGIWIQQAKLTAADAAVGDEFGISVALSGDTAIVGAHMDDDAGGDCGSAYVFVRDDQGTPDRSDDTWSQQAKLTANDAAAEDFFGTSVGLSGVTALVGAWGDNDAGSDSGSAYVFVRFGTNWAHQAKLTASDAAMGDSFGTSVGLSGETALVGAPMNDGVGSAYVFVRGGSSWSQEDKLTASDAGAADGFGSSVGLSGDLALVGAPMDDDAGGDSGSAYVFVRSAMSWSQEDKLNTLDAAPGDSFGLAVALSADMALVGAAMDDVAGGDSGSAYVFMRDGSADWRLQNRFTASDAAAGDIFGSAVALSGGTALVGAPGDDDGGDGSGSAYLFETSVVQYGIGLPGSGDITPRIGTGGETPHVGNSLFQIKITGGVGGAPCVIAGSLARAEIPFFGGVLYGDFLTPNTFVALSFFTSGLAGIPGIGTARLPVPIPNDTTLIGLTTYWQAFVSDTASSSPLAVSHSGGLAVMVIR